MKRALGILAGLVLFLYTTGFVFMLPIDWASENAHRSLYMGSGVLASEADTVMADSTHALYTLNINIASLASTSYTSPSCSLWVYTVVKGDTALVDSLALGPADEGGNSFPFTFPPNHHYVVFKNKSGENLYVTWAGLSDE